MKTASQKYRAILFDMDGLMVDTERLYLQANDRIAARYGTTVTMGTIAKMMGRATLESLHIFADDLGIAADRGSARRSAMSSCWNWCRVIW